MTTMTRDEFDQAMKELLVTEEIKPYIEGDALPNGLQVRGKTEIKKVGFGVSASLELFNLAKKANCDMVVVHHGMIVQSPNLDTISYERFLWLIRHDISLWSAHLILDSHPAIGHSAQIIKFLGGEITEPYFLHDGPWGWTGQLNAPQPLDEIVKKLKPEMSPAATIYDFGKKEIKKIVCVTGKGAPYSGEMGKLVDDKVDLYITGEVHEWNRDCFKEAKVNFIAGGHYHTEAFGTKALQEVVEKDWGLKTVWLDLENPV